MNKIIIKYVVVNCKSGRIASPPKAKHEALSIAASLNEQLGYKLFDVRPDV